MSQSDRLLPLDTEGLSKKISAANRAAHQAVADSNEAARAADQLHRQIPAAHERDKHAARAAAEQGKEPSSLEESKARAAAEEAHRIAAAKLANARQRERALLAAIVEERDSYIASRMKVIDAAVKPLTSAVPELLESLGRFEVEVGLLGAARRTADSRSSLGAPVAGVHDAGEVKRRYDKAKAKQEARGPHHKQKPVARDLASLLAAVSLLVEEMVADARDGGGE